MQVQEAQRIPEKLVPRRNTPRHIIITLPKVKDKERILKAAREKRVIYKEVPIRLLSDFSKETLQARRSWKEIFKIMKGKDLHPRLLYPAKLSFIYFLGFYLFIFLERGERKEKGRETLMCGCLLSTLPLGTWPTTQACALTRNQSSDPLVYRPVLNPLSHTSQGANLSFRMDGQRQGFPDKVKLKEFIITKPLLYEMLKGFI